MNAGTQTRLRDIEMCFHGVVPASVCTVALDGTPNIAYLSIVHRIDDEHIGLSRQFFNKTIANLLAFPRAQVLIIDPDSARQYRIDVLYERTVTEGELFDRMRINLDAVASQTGMSKVFKLAAVDICKVVECEPLPMEMDISPPSRARVELTAVDIFTRRISAAMNTDDLLTVALDSLAELFGYENSFLLLVDERGDRLYTVASRGYPTSGAGSEVRFGDGIIGVAAERRQTISLANLPGDLTYSAAVRSSYERAGGVRDLESQIDLPGLPNTFSQLAVPITFRDKLLGLLCLQSEVPARFRGDDEAMVNVAAREIGLALALLRADAQKEPTFVAQIERPQTTPDKDAVQFRHFPADDSIFVGTEYLIKGVAGQILWRLLQSYVKEQRVDFSNKEIRLDPTLDLPDIKDNLEARLALLRRRLEDRCPWLEISSTGWGRFRLSVDRAITLREMEDEPAALR